MPFWNLVRKIFRNFNTSIHFLVFFVVVFCFLLFWGFFEIPGYVFSWCDFCPASFMPQKFKSVFFWRAEKRIAPLRNCWQTLQECHIQIWSTIAHFGSEYCTLLLHINGENCIKIIMLKLSSEANPLPLHWV